MSNDLLFSVLPREGKIPVVSDDRVKRVSKESKAKELSEDEKDTHEEERIISEQQQYRVHEKASGEQSDEQPHSNEQHPQQLAAEADDDEELLYNNHGETESHPPVPENIHHIDTYE